MNIESVEITEPKAGSFSADMEGVAHKKALPCVSVVQAVHGRYEISIDGGETHTVPEGGVFAAPADARQLITHRNGAGGIMRAQWAFLNITVNGNRRFEDCFSFPTVLPYAYNERIGTAIRTVLNGGICSKYAAAYDLAQILLDNSTEKPLPDKTQTEIRQYVSARFAEDIRCDDIAEHLHVSAAQVYRYTKKYFGLSPANYVNRIRLQNALKLLHDPTVQIKSAAIDSGFVDLAYFSRLFKQTFGMTPSAYKKKSGY